MQWLGEGIEASSRTALRIGEWRIDPSLNQISRGQEVVHLEPKAVDLLFFLAGRSGEVVSRGELLAALWPGVIVGDNALTQVVIKLRKALGDTAREPTYIQAISKRGYRLLATVDAASPLVRAGTSPRGSTPRWRNASLWAGAALASAMLAGTVAWIGLAPGEKEVAPSDAVPGTGSWPPTTLPMVVVKPFEVAGDDAQQLLLARGITADLVTDLSKVASLWVASGIEAHDPAAPVAKTTRAAGSARPRYVLAGTVQRDGERLRLQVRLADGDSGRQLWSQRFERSASDLFAVQDDLVQSILAVLPIKVSEAEKLRLSQRYTRNLEAYEYFLQGQAALQMRSRDQIGVGRDLMWRAVRADPAFARAYAGLAISHALEFREGWASDEAAALGRALELAATAAQMNPTLPEAHWVLGYVQTQRKQHSTALQHMNDALRLNPSFADAYAMSAGIHTYVGKPGETIALIRTAQRLNPDGGSLYSMVIGRAYYFLGDHEQARLNLDYALQRNPENVEVRLYLAAALRELGESDAAAWQVQEIFAMQPGFNMDRWLANHPITDPGFRQRLAQALQALGQPR